MLDFPYLNDQAHERSFDYANAKPYPHICIDNMLPAEVALAAADSIGAPADDGSWDFYFAEGYEEKWANSNELKMPEVVRNLIYTFNSGAFIRVLEKLTGIAHLLPDPHLFGAGIHLIRKGGLLQIHSDFNWSEDLMAHRRVNMFLYLNNGWQESWGGALELWDPGCENKICEYAPLFNRVVIFNSRSDTYHGHPHPLSCPEGVYRKSIAMYYYTTSRPQEELTAPHNTRYKGLHL